MPNNSEVSITIGRPQPKQVEFMRAKARYIAYGGARGGGKTWAVRAKAHILAAKYPGIKILIMRKTFPELETNHIVPLKKLSNDCAEYREAKKTLYYVNGSVIIFGFMSAASDIDRYQGQEYDVIFIDEATQFAESVFTKLKPCVRGTNSFPKRIYLTCNPGGIGHSWVKRLFIDRIYRDGEDPDDYVFIQAKVTDNAELVRSNPEYVRVLESLPDGLREMWLDGRWDVTAGSYFSEFDREANVISPITCESWWKYYCAIDYGLDALAAVVVAIDGAGNEYVVRELEQSGLVVSEAAKALKSLTSGLEISEWYAPPDLWSRQKDSGKSIIELFADAGIIFLRASNDRVSGWLNVKEHIRAQIFPGEETKRSRLRIFSSCKRLIECLPQLLIDERNPNDCMTQPHEITHICDALRYFCVMSGYFSSAVKPEQEDYIAKHRRLAMRGALSSRGKRF